MISKRISKKGAGDALLTYLSILGKESIVRDSTLRNKLLKSLSRVSEAQMRQCLEKTNASIEKLVGEE